MLHWFERIFRRLGPVPLPPPKPAEIAKPVALRRVFPPLPAADRHLARQVENTVSEAEITSAIALLRGGAARPSASKSRVTRPARFQLALRQLKGFSADCLMVHAGSRVNLHDMYAGYLLWAADNSQAPISASDFDFAMSDYLGSVGGIRAEHSYNGCRFRQVFLRRLEDMNGKEAKRRLGMGLEELMASKRPNSDQA